MSPRVDLILPAAVLVLASATACTGNGVTPGRGSTIAPIAVTWSRDHWAPEPSAMTASPQPAVVASVAWDDQGRILLSTWWSSSCPQLPVALDLVSPTDLIVTVA